MAVVLGMGVPASGAHLEAAPVTVRLTFTASSFGGGPNRTGGSPGAPVQQLRGRLTIRYTLGRLSDARLISVRVVAVASPQSPAWTTTPTSRDVVLRIARSDGPPWRRSLVLQVGGGPCGLRLCPGRDDFTLAIELRGDGLAPGSVRFRSAGYAVTGEREAYAARAGTVRVTTLATG